MPKILIAEDEHAIARLLELELGREGFDVDVFHDGKSALAAALQGEYDLLLLDIMMPEMDGFEVLHQVRAQSEIPIILLTARGALEDKVQALGDGADDYIVKPFAMAEVVARIRTNLRRAPKQPPETVLHNGNLSVNLETFTVKYKDTAIEVTKRELELIIYFMRNIGKVCTRAEILKEVWGFDYIGDTNLIDVYIRYLRAKIDNVFGTQYFKTVRGFGYIMEKTDE